MPHEKRKSENEAKTFEKYKRIKEKKKLRKKKLIRQSKIKPTVTEMIFKHKARDG